MPFIGTSEFVLKVKLYSQILNYCFQNVSFSIAHFLEHCRAPSHPSSAPLSRVPGEGKIENDLIKMKQYPTLMSGIVESINLSGAKEDKALVQKYSDGLSFNLTITDNSWHRNRIGYVISLLGSLRWHGGRIPNCMEFIIQESNKNPHLKSLKNIVKLFLGGFHGNLKTFRKCTSIFSLFWLRY